MPRRRAWAGLRPGTEVPCTPREAAQWINRQIPGAKGGVVVGCATPSKRKPNKGQLVLNTGARISKSVARDRIRGADSIETPDAEQYVAQYQASGLPMPTGLPYRHRRGSSRCDDSNPLWSGYDAAVEGARERVAIEMADEMERRVVERVRAEHPEWVAAADYCARQVKERTKRKATQSRSREIQQARAAFVSRGGDTTSAEYIDDVLGPGRKPRKRRRK